MSHEHHKPASFHSSPREAMQSPPEEFLYLACLHEGTGVNAPDFLAVVDAEGGRIVHELPMPNMGDELHHYGWNRCSSACHGPDRSHLIVPGFRSSRIHIINVADDPRKPRIEKVIEPQELIEKTGYTRPHTVHCMPGENVVISMLGDADGNGVGGFAPLFIASTCRHSCSQPAKPCRAARSRRASSRLTPLTEAIPLARSS